LFEEIENETEKGAHHEVEEDGAAAEEAEHAPVWDFVSQNGKDHTSGGKEILRSHSLRGASDKHGLSIKEATVSKWS
jgi:hypothetical protein